ncbi:MAG: nicotinamidase-like amidase [Actinomycetia bacterium]|nr:nicotinamidase-like amidase [Actinomycetes bacterium]
MRQPMIVGNPVLIVVDMQNSGGRPIEEVGIPIMDGYEERRANALEIVAAARRGGVPVIFFQEAHRRNLVDFGRELDGTEGIHCLEGDATTELDPALLPEDGEYHIVKRRYSCFFGTELEILLKGLRADTLVLIGGLTDVCVHYTFADGHQRDYFMRVVEDCVGGSSFAAHDASLAAMEYLQGGARVTTATVIDAFALRADPSISSVPASV